MGRRVALAGRGTTFVRDVPGPAGAPTLLLLHGLGANADLNWFTCFGALGREFRVLAIDQRGHGRGIRSGARFHFSDCADDAVALADALAVDRFIAVGYSMGGPVAQLTWRRHRDRVAGLVLCATSRDFSGTPRERMMFAVLPGLSTAMRVAPPRIRRGLMGGAIAGRLGDGPLARWAANELGRNDPAAMMAAAGALGRFSSREWIGEVDVPAAVVLTMRDSVVPPHRQRKLAAAIPGATVHLVDADHGACAAAPRLFVPALVEACRSVASRTQRLWAVSGSAQPRSRGRPP
jgi:pimeloyl-ACP methyl ester carboxylesterase